MESLNEQISRRDSFATRNGAGLTSILIILLPSCGRVRAESDSPSAVTVGATQVTRKSLRQQFTLSSEFVPFQQIDVYAKESGFVKSCTSIYGRRVQTGLLIPFRLKGLRTPWGQQRTLPIRPSNCIDHGYSSGEFRIYRRPQAMRIRGGSRT